MVARASAKAAMADRLRMVPFSSLAARWQKTIRRKERLTQEFGLGALPLEQRDGNRFARGLFGTAGRLDAHRHRRDRVRRFRKRTKVSPEAPGLNVTDGAIFFEPFGNVQAW